MVFLTLLAFITTIIVVTSTAILLVDVHFDRKEENKRQARKALQEKYRKLMEG